VTGLVAQFRGKLVDVDPLEQIQHRLAADVGLKALLSRDVFFHLQHAAADLEILLFIEQLADREPAFARAGDDVGLVIDDLFQFLDAHAKDIADLGGQGFPIPDVDHRHGQGDVSHALTANAFHRHFDAAAVAGDALVTDALIFSAMTFPVAHRPENLFTKETVFLRLERAVIDGLRFGHFALGTL